MNRSIRRLLVGLSFATWLLAYDAVACVFIGGPEPPCSAFWKADTVFVGTVTNLTKTSPEPQDQFEKTAVRFLVVDTFRGDKADEVDVITTSGTDCSTEFKIGEKWLVYATRSRLTGRLMESVRTRLYSGAQEDLSYINNLSAGKVETAIFGRVFSMLNDSWEGIRIEIIGNGSTFRTATDKDGRFQLVPAKPGAYLIRGLFPPRSDLSGWRMPKRFEMTKRFLIVEFEEEVEAGHCTYLQFQMIRVTSRKADKSSTGAWK